MTGSGPPCLRRGLLPWAAARLQDQSLEGDLNGEGTLQFGAGYLSGDGQIAITNGRFEDKLSGVSLVNLDALISIDDHGVNIEHFTAAGPHGGRLTATGGSASPTEGRIAVTLDNMRVADRGDARAQGSGDLTLQWRGMRSSLSGELNIAEANLDIAAQPAAGIPTIVTPAVYTTHQDFRAAALTLPTLEGFRWTDWALRHWSGTGAPPVAESR